MQEELSIQDQPRRDRFPLRENSMLNNEQKRVVQEIESKRGKIPAPYTPLLGSPHTARQFECLSASLWKGALPVRILEFVYLVTASEYRCIYQWQAHKCKGLDAGISAELIHAIGKRELLKSTKHAAEDLMAIHLFLRELHTDHRVAEATFARLASHFDEVQMSELLAFCGMAASVALLLNVRQAIHLETAEQPFC